MANSAGDAGHSECEIRKQLIETGTVDVMVAIGTNFFYTVTLPVTLWFLDKSKRGISVFGGEEAGDRETALLQKADERRVLAREHCGGSPDDRTAAFTMHRGQAGFLGRGCGAVSGQGRVVTAMPTRPGAWIVRVSGS
jgi:N-6 DNA Methylase